MIDDLEAAEALAIATRGTQVVGIQAKRRAEMLAMIAPLVAAGKHIGEIADACGLPETNVRYWCIKFGLKPRRKTHVFTVLALERGRLIIEMRAGGATLEAIGQRFGFTRERARQILAKHRPDLAVFLKQETAERKAAQAEILGIRKRERLYERWTKLRRVVELRCSGATWAEVCKDGWGYEVVVHPGPVAFWRTQGAAKSLGVDISWLTRSSPKERMAGLQTGANAPSIPDGWIERYEARFKP